MFVIESELLDLRAISSAPEAIIRIILEYASFFGRHHVDGFIRGLWVSQRRRTLCDEGALKFARL